MLIVLQGPRGSGKTTLAKFIEQMAPNVHVYDNVSYLLDEARKLSRTEHVVITTIKDWPYPQDFVWKLEPISIGSFKPQGDLVV